MERVLLLSAISLYQFWLLTHRTSNKYFKSLIDADLPSTGNNIYDGLVNEYDSIGSNTNDSCWPMVILSVKQTISNKHIHDTLVHEVHINSTFTTAKFMLHLPWWRLYQLHLRHPKRKRRSNGVERNGRRSFTLSITHNASQWCMMGCMMGDVSFPIHHPKQWSVTSFTSSWQFDNEPPGQYSSLTWI